MTLDDMVELFSEEGLPADGCKFDLSDSLGDVKEDLARLASAITNSKVSLKEAIFNLSDNHLSAEDVILFLKAIASSEDNELLSGIRFIFLNNNLMHDQVFRNDGMSELNDSSSTQIYLPDACRISFVKHKVAFTGSVHDLIFKSQIDAALALIRQSPEVLKYKFPDDYEFADAEPEFSVSNLSVLSLACAKGCNHVANNSKFADYSKINMYAFIQSWRNACGYAKMSAIIDEILQLHNKGYDVCINNQDSLGNTALHIACFHRDESLIDQLVYVCAKQQLRNEDEFTPVETIGRLRFGYVAVATEIIPKYVGSIDSHLVYGEMSQVNRFGANTSYTMSAQCVWEGEENISNCRRVFEDFSHPVKYANRTKKC